MRPALPAARMVVSGLIAAGLALSAQAEPAPGRDDPAFAAPFARALAGEDDPAIPAALHAAAEAGNSAALLALPFVLAWMPLQGPLAEKNKLRRINGERLDDALAAGFPAIADWAGAARSDPDSLPLRIERLLAEDEPGKAGELLMLWINITAASGPPPHGLYDSDIPDWMIAMALDARLTWAPGPAADADLLRLLKDDRMAAWMVLARPGPDGTPRFAVDRLAEAAGLPADRTAERMATADLLLRMILRNATPDAAEAATAAAALAGESDFRAVESLCAAHCPDDPATCAVDWVGAYSYPPRVLEYHVPPVALVPAAEFWATPRGASLLLAELRAPDTAPRPASCLAGIAAPGAP